MILRQATIEDLPALSECAREFYSASKFLHEFHIERFCETWAALLSGGTGVIFIVTEGDEIKGTIGGVAYPEPYSFDLICQEFFLFVKESARGGFGMLKLYRAFEAWARDKGCSQIRMGHLQDSMPERLHDVYLKLGYVHVETAYAKQLGCR